MTLDLTILQPATGTDIQTACESYTWIDNVIYTSSNNTATYTITGGAANGCDSIVTLDLTILQPATGTDVQMACESFTWLDDVVYTSSNNTATYTISGGAANGCDSIVTLDLTILQPATGTNVQTACESFTWIDNVVYTVSTNTASYTFPGGASNGCDSIVTLNLTILQPTAAVFNESFCGGTYTWAVNGESYTAPGIYTDTLINAAGCDSVVTLNLSLNTMDVTTQQQGVVLTANANGASYQWLDCDNGYETLSGATAQSFTATENGNYAVAITQNSCTDTSDCLSVSTVGLEEAEPTSGFSIYPNPTNGDFRVLFGDVQNTIKVRILTLAGQETARYVFTNTDSCELTINGAAGVYLVEVSSDRGTVIRRLVKKE